ncbi:MAG: DUF1738 domain-containing protein [Clostridia bacterium]|nr:DUF1738 domain-containing protein [Clostridia bacterium]
MKKKDNNKTKELYKKIVDGIQNIIDSGEYQKFLKFSKYFRNYSFNNIILIFSQMEDATYVAGFKAWQTMGRKIKKGERGIQIMYPLKRKHIVKIKGQESLLDKNEENVNEKTVEYLTYRPTYVYDISQTTGNEILVGMKRLETNNKSEFFEFLKNYSKYPVLEKSISRNSFGYWSPTNQHIVLEKTLSIDDKVSTLLHELTHALYDDFDYKENRDLSEIFVESVAYIVADFFDLDTSMCSFDYITKWSNGDLKPILELGNKVQKTANDFINKLEKEFYNDNIKIAI